MDEADDITMELERLSAIAPIPLLPSEPVRLFVVAGPDAGRRITFTAGASVGRASDATLPLRDTLVSRQHLRFARETDGRCSVEDLKSRNGTLLNGSPLTRATASFGDRIQIGATLLIFAPVDPIEDAVAQREKLTTVGRLTGGVVHDLNDLLTTVLASGEVAREIAASDAPTEADLAELAVCVDDITAAARHAAELMRGLLGVARRAAVESRPVDLSSIVTDAIDLARRTFPRAISVRRAVAADIRVLGDTIQLRHMVLDLLMRARDALGPRGHISVGLARSVTGVSARTSAELVIEGSGSETDAAGRAALDGPRSLPGSGGIGTGAVLAAVQEIARAHGARVEGHHVEGAGSRVRITLPLAPAESSARATLRSALRADPNAPSATVLLVEPDPSLERAFTRALTRGGHRVLVAHDVETGLQTCADPDASIDAVILELDTVEIDDTVITRLWAVAPGARVVALSSRCDAERAAHLERLGAVAVLDKPCRMDELVLAVSKRHGARPT